MFNLCFESINYIFGTDKEKNSLKDRLLEWKRKVNYQHQINGNRNVTHIV